MLGSTAAERLGVWRLGTRVWLGGEWFAVVGVLAPVPLAVDLDSAALVGWGSARTYLAFDGRPTNVYVRVLEGAGLATTLMVGGLAGLYPAIRAARLPPTEALAAA